MQSQVTKTVSGKGQRANGYKKQKNFLSTVLKQRVREYNSKLPPLEIWADGNDTYIEGRLFLINPDRFPQKIYARMLFTISKDEGLYPKLKAYIDAEKTLNKKAV